MPVIELGQNKPEDEVKVIEATTAFLVFIADDNQVMMSPDINIPLITERQANLGEIKMALARVLSDIEVQETAIQAAQHVVNAQMQLANQMRNQAEANAALSRLDLSKTR